MNTKLRKEAKNDFKKEMNWSQNQIITQKNVFQKNC